MLSNFVVIVSIVVIIGSLLILSGFKKLRCRCVVSGCSRFLGGCSLIMVGVLLLGAGANLYTYQRLVKEQWVGIISVQKIDKTADVFTVVFKRSSGVETYELGGDQWRLDSKILKWKGIASLLGFDTVFRLDRISGRYQDIDVAMKKRVRMYSLSGLEGIDLWRWAHEHTEWVPWIDAIYGNGVYMPLKDGAQYEVQVGLTGLIARPLN